MGELTSAAVPGVGPRGSPPRRGTGGDRLPRPGLPSVRLAWTQIRELPLRLVLRHFPIASKHPRAPALHAAAEAAGLQEAFCGDVWTRCSRDQAHVDDPHLWERAESLGLDLERFNRERRSELVVERVRRDFEDGIRAGVTGTPAAFIAGRPVGKDVAESLRVLS